ncbi:FecR family protein [uncultured Roseobacter sp.]|uniref:FecR family protein n=1 Tax=uncultured Roseobacter sp. TaxID=114847 RepID=UPI00260999DA|nr:FecR family protein [uncultured Roseobacter sp.]
MSDPPRQAFTCSPGFVMEREPSAAITIKERPGDAPPRAIELQNGAILINVVPGSRATQIRTPEAIAAVRGTVYIVDARAGETSVFVLEGEVTVTRPGDSSVFARVNAGEGADVSKDSGIVVSRWPQDRAVALRARFGR